MKLPFAVLFSLFGYGVFASDETPELSIERIDEHVYLHKSFSRVEGYGLVSSNGLVVVEDAKAFIVDTPWSDRDTEKLVNWIKANHYTLLGSISTHSHEDRTAGIKWLNEQSVATYATALTNKILHENNREPAKYTLKEDEITLANGLLEVFYPGGGHTVDNVVVWLPKSKLLFGGCFVRSLESKGLGNTGEADVEQWPRSAEKLINQFPDANIVVPGHGKFGDTRLLKHTKFLAETAANKLVLPHEQSSAD